jgi:membrane peptidoglycan carboxypeptidase
MALFWRGFAFSVSGLLALVLVAVALSLGIYVYVALTLPSPEELQPRAASFVSTKILDRNGELLYVINDPLGGRRTLVRLEDIPLDLRNATIATEDPTFYSNPGFNPLAIARALYYNLKEGEIVSGASTITQQLVKTLFVGTEVSLKRKVKEAVLAAEITRTYEKDTILEIYLNEIYYGNLAYGVAAAAETYFNKPVSELTLAESALLVGIVPAPVAHDPYTHREAALAARDAVLDKMVRHGYITAEQAEAAKAEPLTLAKRRIDMLAPHFVVYVREQLEQQYGRHGGGYIGAGCRSRRRSTCAFRRSPSRWHGRESPNSPGRTLPTLRSWPSIPRRGRSWPWSGRWTFTTRRSTDR